MKEQKVIKCEYTEIEDLVNKYLKPEGWVGKTEYSDFYSLVADQECGNYESHEFTVDGDIDPDDREMMDEFLTGERHHNYLTGILMNRLAQLGHLDKGEYVVSVSW